MTRLAQAIDAIRAGLPVPEDCRAAVLAVLEEPPRESWVLRPRGKGWQIGRSENPVQLRTRKEGFVYLRFLVQYPHQLIHCLQLHQGEDTITFESSDPVLDQQAVRDIQARARTIAEELEDDTLSTEDRERLKDEQDTLMQYVRASMGLRGARTFSTQAERARVNCQKKIRAAINEIAQKCPELADHLSDSISTGFHLAYCPERLPDWNI